LLTVLGKNVSLLDAFKSANDVLLNAVQGIAELITRPGLINVDFADVRTVMSEMGIAMMGSGSARGNDRAREAAEIAIGSPLLEDVNLSGARGILVNVTAGLDLSIGEFEEVGNTIKEFASENATVVVGTVIDPDMQDELRVTVVATGIGAQQQAHAVPERREPAREPVEDPRAVKLVKKKDGELDYSHLDRPTIMRNQQVSGDRFATNTHGDDLDYLDIPAFLRRQAD
jgi:cell division protein FtsZ